MGVLEIFLIGVGLSMDAFAVSICKGLSLGKIKGGHMCIAGGWFGGFQFLMPVTGYFLGSFFANAVTSFAHWIAFVLLAYIGGKMVKEALESGDDHVDGAMDAKTMLLLAIATSIDALAVGITFAFMQVAVIPASLLIGCTTFTISAVGVKIGSVFGNRYQKKAEICGGVVLVLIGIKILLEGVGIL